MLNKDSNVQRVHIPKRNIALETPYHTSQCHDMGWTVDGHVVAAVAVTWPVSARVTGAILSAAVSQLIAAEHGWISDRYWSTLRHTDAAASVLYQDDTITQFHQGTHSPGPW